MRERRIKVRGLDVSLSESEGSGPTVFLTHGNSSSAQSFSALLDNEIARRLRLVAIDFPGHGASSWSRNPERDYTIPGIVEFVTELIEAEKSHEYFLVGHSLGGHVLIEALPRLTRALGLILISAPPFSASSLGAVYKPDPTDGCLFKGELGASEVRRFAEALVDPERVSRETFTTVETSIRKTDLAFRPSLGASLAQGRFGDERAIAAAARLPIAMLYGETDPFIHTEYYGSVKLAQPWRGTPMQFPKCGHALHLQAPEDFARFVAEFCGGARGA